MFATPIRAIAFDLDGTLVDSLPDLSRAANAVRAELGLPALADARVRSFVGDGAAMLMARTILDTPDASVDDSPLQTRARTAFQQHYLATLSTGTQLYPGVHDGLSALAERGLPLACVTNKPMVFTQPLLLVLGLSHYFSLVLGGDSLARKKPDPQPLAHTAQQFGVAPAALLMVGDSSNDILAARAHGSPVLAVSYGYTESVAALQADGVIDSLAEIGPLLGS